MNNKEKEILDFINSNGEHEVYEFTRCRIIKETDTQILFEVTHMYNYNDEDREKLKSSRLNELAHKLGFSEFEIYEDISSSGCDTCDYGSNYGKAIRFWR